MITLQDYITVIKIMHKPYKANSKEELSFEINQDGTRVAVLLAKKLVVIDIKECTYTINTSVHTLSIYDLVKELQNILELSEI